jgi:serine protease Do
MIRRSTFTAVLVLALVAGTVGLAAQTSYRDAEQWFNSLALDVRAEIQFALIWVGAYNGLVDGQFGRRTHGSIVSFQQGIGARPAGILSPSDSDRLSAMAAQVMSEVGFDVISDPRTGLRLGLPLGLLPKSEPTRRGFAWWSPDRSIEVETVSIPVAEQSYVELYERMARERAGRRVTYRTLKPTFFIVSGQLDGTRNFYARFMPGPTATRGFSLAWDTSQSPMVDRVAVAMSSLLMADDGDAAPPPQPPADFARREPESPGTGGLSTGSGFFVSPAGHLVTNDHVVEGCREIDVRLADGRIGGATVLTRSNGDDLAVLKVDMAPPAAAQFRAGQPVRLGEGVVVFGFPLVGSLGSSSGVLSTGHVSALAGPGDHSGILQMSAPVQSGNSGGPLIDQSGNVIGVVTWKSGLLFGDGKIEVLQNMNFAVKSSVVTNLLDAHGVPYVTAASEMDKPTTDIAEAARQYTALVACR